MKISHARRFCVLFCAVSLASCAGASRAPAPPDARGGVRKAALAHVTVDNQTDRRLAVGFRSAAAGSSAEVIVGSVPAHASARVAPVLAGEPIALIARTDEKAELVLPPRTFAADEAWVWVIDPGARFEPAAGEER